MNADEGNPFAGLAALLRAPAAQSGFVIGEVTAVQPLRVNVGDLPLEEGDMVLTDCLREQTRAVTMDWRTADAASGNDAPHSHALAGRLPLTLHSPLQPGDRLILLPSADEQTYYAVGRF